MDLHWIAFTENLEGFYSCGNSGCGGLPKELWREFRVLLSLTRKPQKSHLLLTWFSAQYNMSAAWMNWYPDPRTRSSASVYPSTIFPLHTKRSIVTSHIVSRRLQVLLLRRRSVSFRDVRGSEHYFASQAKGVKSSLCLVLKIMFLVRISRMDGGCRGVAMAKRASWGGAFPPFSCRCFCPWRNFSRPWMFNAWRAGGEPTEIS